MEKSELEKRVEILENQVRTLQDIEEIKILQRAYGYYFEHLMVDEIVDLFADGPDVDFDLGELGIFKGKAGVRRYFDDYIKGPERIDQVMQLSGIVHVDPSGNTAKGRWYHWGGVAIPKEKGVRQFFLSGIYENEYVKQDGVWKIKAIRQRTIYAAHPAQGWVKPERAMPPDPNYEETFAEPDIPDELLCSYPSGYILPFHFKHPVTGKASSEEVYNAEINRQPPKH